MQFVNVVILPHSRTLLSTSFDSTARVTSVRSLKSNGMLTSSFLDNLASPVISVSLSCDRCKCVARDTSYHSWNFGVLLYATQRRFGGNVAALRFLLRLY
jgi:WD40 repeat protein